MKHFYALLVTLIMTGLGYSQTTIYTQDFETVNDGYTASSTEGSGFTDVFNRTNPNVGGNSSFIWAIEDTNITPASITLDPIDVTGYADFTFTIDMLAHHYNDWDDDDTFSITYSLDGGATQNLLWVRNAGAEFNQAASIDTDFDGIGDCGSGILPAITTGNSGCNVTSNTFATFSSSTITLSGNTTLDIVLSFEGMTSTDEGMYLDNIEVEGNLAAGGCTPPAVQASTFTTLSASTTDVNIEFTRGYGDDVLVVMKEGSAVDADPTNGTSYTANSVFNGPGASEIGTGNYVVFNGNNGTSNPGVGGSSLSISVSGLNPSTTYYLAIYEYYTTDTCYNLTAFTGDFTTTDITKVQFSSTSASVAESAGIYDLVIEIANEDVAATTFDVVLTSGDASDIDSYTTQSETFPGSSTTDITVTITVTDDAIIETDEVFTFEIQNVAGGNSATVGTNNAFDLTITNNDFPTTVEFTSSSNSVSEGDGTYDLEFSIANEDAAATSFDVVFIGGTGDASDIATYTTQTVTFPGGTSANQTATLTITDDMLFEGDETLIFEIQNVTGGNSAVTGTESSFTLTITDNDTPPPCNSIFADDFTSDLSQWSSIGDWTISSGELKHDLSNIESESYIYTDLGVQDYTSTDYEWEFCMRNGNWDPSVNNKFAFTLFSDASNLLFQPTGYAVGVNQSDSSDDIKLYSVNNGVYTSIIESTFDWNSNEDVCIRVTRSASGAWELFYDNNGSGEVSAGTTTNTTYTSGNYLGATFNFTSSRAGLLYIDDINVCKVEVASLNDTDTEVNDPTTQVDAATITAASSTTSGTAFDALKFKVEDQGSGDALATNITTMHFVPGPNNTADWIDHLQGVTLLDGNAVSYTPTTTITDTEIILTFGSAIAVADGSSLEFLLGLYLNETAIVDGSVIQLQINGTSSGFDADLSGSDFADPFSSGDITGNNMTIDVDASELRFVEQPTNVFVNTLMSPSVSVAYTDVNGNIDVDYSGEGLGFNISLVGGSFDTSATTTVEAINGIATFDNLLFDTVNTAVVLTATDDSTFISGTYDSNPFDIMEIPIGTIDLFFSEYVEGSSNNKYLEIYNGTDEVVILTDYSIELYANGDTSPNNTEDFTVNFPTTLGIGEVIVLEHSDAVIYGGTAYSSSVCNFNGDDAIVLKKGGVIIDIIGNIGCDPGSEWSDGGNDTSDRTIIRNNDICEGVTTNPSDCTFPTLGSDWTGYPQNYIDNLGSHTANCGTPIVYTYSDAWSPSDPNGSSTVNDIIVIESGDANISSSTDINSITVNPGASLTIDSGATLNISDVLNLESTSALYSSLISNGTINGTVNYERFVNIIGSGAAGTGGNDLVSVPLFDFDIDYQRFLGLGNPENRSILATNGANTLHAFGPYDNENLNFINYPTYPSDAPPSPAAEQLIIGKGYRAATTAGANLTFSGLPPSTDVSIEITTPAGGSQWNLVGNPYPSYLNAKKFIEANASVLDNTAVAIYAYNSDSYSGNAHTSGNFTVINLATIDALTSENFNIAPGQGFFIAATNTPTFQDDVVFNMGPTAIEDMRTTSGSDDYITGRSNETNYMLRLNLETNTLNSTSFFFNANSSLGLDPGYDAAVYGENSNNYPIYSHLVQDNTGRAIAVQALNLNDLSDITIPLGINASQGEQITFSIDTNTLPSTVEIYLEDNVTNTFTLLNVGEYTMTPNSNLFGTGRFFLRISNGILSNPENGIENLSIYNNEVAKTVVIDGQLLMKSNVNIYDLQGRIVKNSTLQITNSRSQSIDVSQLSTGIYIVELANTIQSKTQKIIIR